MRGLTAALLAAGLMAPRVAAQVPDSTAAPGPPADSTATAAVPQAGAPKTDAPAPLSYAPVQWALSITVGTLGFGTLQTQPVLAERVDGLGTVLSSTTLTRTVRGEGGFQVGAAGVLSLSRDWAARVGVAVARSTLGARFSGTDDLFVATANRLTKPLDVDVTSIAIEAGVRYRLPSSRRARPYIELGGAALRWTPGSSTALPELEDAWRHAVYAAVGAVIPLSGPWLAEVRAVRRLSRTPAPTAGPASVGPPSMVLHLTAEPSGATAYADAAQELLSELRFDVGISVGFGTLPPPDRSGTAAPPSPPAL